MKNAVTRAFRPHLDKALLKAVEEADFETVVSSLENGADPNALDRNGAPALCLAAAVKSDRRPEIVAALLDAGADPNAGYSLRNQDQEDLAPRTCKPLHTALTNVDVRCSKLLLDAGADPNIMYFDGGGDHYFSGLQMMIDSAYDGNADNGKLVELVRLLLAAGADPNFKDKDAYMESPLYDAVCGGPEEMVDMMIAAGANVNDAENSRAAAPLHAAAQSGSVAVVRRLLLAGADPNMLDKDGRSPLHMAAEKGRAETVRTLAAVSDPNAVDVYGKRPIHYAAACGDEKTLIALSEEIERAAGLVSLEETIAFRTAEPSKTQLRASDRAAVDVRATDGLGRGALHLAAKAGPVRSVELLIAAGTDVNALDQDGRTPIYYSRDGETAELLMSYGAAVKKLAARMSPLDHFLYSDPADDASKEIPVDEVRRRRGEIFLACAAQGGYFRSPCSCEEAARALEILSTVVDDPSTHEVIKRIFPMFETADVDAVRREKILNDLKPFLIAETIRTAPSVDTDVYISV